MHTLMANQPWPQFPNGIRERSVETAPEHFDPTFLLQSLNDFWVSNRSYLSACICFILYTDEVKLWVLTGNALLIATRKREIQV